MPEPSEGRHRGRENSRNLRAVITGVGLRTPAGFALPDFWRVLCMGRSLVTEDPSLVAGGAPVRISARIPSFDPTDHLTAKEARRLDRAVQLGVCAALDALEDAGRVNIDPTRGGVIAATGIGCVRTFEDQFRLFSLEGPRSVAPMAVPGIMSNGATALIAMRSGWHGPTSCIVTACAAGAQAIGEGAEMIRSGRADAMIVGGFESAISPWNISAFWRVAALSSRHADPERSSRPFDVNRDGFVMGEGAAFFVLEELESARSRGATIYAEVAGYGCNNDAHHLTAPMPTGESWTSCMKMALTDAGLHPTNVTQLNAHGTATRLNDLVEARAIADVFGPDGIPVTAPKSIFGHLIGASGAVEAAGSILSMLHGVVPPSANCDQLDADMQVDIVRTQPREVGVGPVMSNSFAFGGHNVCLLFAPLAPSNAADVMTTASTGTKALR